MLTRMSIAPSRARVSSMIRSHPSAVETDSTRYCDARLAREICQLRLGARDGHHTVTARGKRASRRPADAASRPGHEGDAPIRFRRFDSGRPLALSLSWKQTSYTSPTAPSPHQLDQRLQVGRHAALPRRSRECAHARAGERPRCPRRVGPSRAGRRLARPPPARSRPAARRARPSPPAAGRPAEPSSSGPRSPRPGWSWPSRTTPARPAAAPRPPVACPATPNSVKPSSPRSGRPARPGGRPEKPRVQQLHHALVGAGQDRRERDPQEVQRGGQRQHVEAADRDDALLLHVDQRVVLGRVQLDVQLSLARRPARRGGRRGAAADSGT